MSALYGQGCHLKIADGFVSRELVKGSSPFPLKGDERLDCMLRYCQASIPIQIKGLLQLGEFGVMVGALLVFVADVEQGFFVEVFGH